MTSALPAKINVKVKPNSKTEEVIPEDSNSFIVRVKAPPVEGKANRAVIKVLAKHFDIPESRLAIIKGLTSKTKVIQII